MKKPERTSTLNAKEKVRFEACKKQISEGLQSCFDTGMALMEIRDHKLYRDEWDTFEQFCAESYQIGRAHAYRLIEASEVKEDVNLSPIGDKLKNEGDVNLSPIGDKLKNEGQARALAVVPKPERAAVFRAVASSGPVTARRITEAAQSTKPDERFDSIGRVIPADILEDWDRASSVANRLRSCASEIKTTVERGLEDKDIIFAEICNPVISEASGLHYSLSQIIPYAVCPTCQGRGRSNCRMCRRRGWISKYMFNSPAVSSETKAILEKAKR